MKRFLLHTIVFLLIFLISGFVVISQADGTTDAFYVKFTSPKQKSLIVGSSRAAQALRPKVIHDILKDPKLFNYAFSIAHSPYGENYYESITRKVDPDARAGLFFVCVNPWILSSLTKDPEDSLHFRENGSFIETTYSVNSKPNVEYILESFLDKNIRIITNKNRIGEYETFNLHDDGWLEVTLQGDTSSIQARTRAKMIKYKNKEKLYSGFSKTRNKYLEKTISFLQKHGTVYMIRIPVCDEMLTIEKKLVPDFNVKMESIAKIYNVDYIDAASIKNNYTYNDGHHLDKKSSQIFSEFIANQIKQLEPK
jgi:hypothetical protein